MGRIIFTYIPLNTEAENPIDVGCFTYTNTSLCVHWANPVEDYTGVQIRISPDNEINSITDGIVAYEGSGTTIERGINDNVNGTLIAGLNNNTNYYIGLFPFITDGKETEYNDDPIKLTGTTNRDSLPTTQWTFSQNGTFTVPEGVYSIKVSAVGGGSNGGGGGYELNSNDAPKYLNGGNGGGGGYVTKSTISVLPYQSFPVVIGAGNGSTYFGTDNNKLVTANAGGISNGGSGGGGGGNQSGSTYNNAANGGSNGGNGGNSATRSGGTGQGQSAVTINGTIFSGGGGGGGWWRQWYSSGRRQSKTGSGGSGGNRGGGQGGNANGVSSTAGTANTGGGGGGGAPFGYQNSSGGNWYHSPGSGASGGSGYMVIEAL